MRPTERRRQVRRQRRQRRSSQLRSGGRLVLANGFDAEFFDGPALGPEMRTASREEVLAALERFDPTLEWPNARDLLRPLLPRRRPFPVPVDDLVTVLLPPGVAVGFGLDMGPAVAFVGDEQLASWGVGRLDVVDAALANVRRIASGLDPRAVVREPIGDVPTLSLQSGMNIASTLLLVPDVVPHFFGVGPHVLLAPMRDVLIALPGDVDLEFARWLGGEFEALDPNCLNLGAFRHDAGAIVVQPSRIA